VFIRLNNFNSGNAHKQGVFWGNKGKIDKEMITAMKKIFSLNLAGYIKMRIKEFPKIHYDYSPKLGTKWYTVFESENIYELIEDFKNDEYLQEFLQNLKDIVDRKNKLAQEVKKWNQS
jgi:hypothetical protein